MNDRITFFDVEVLNNDPSSICSIGIVIYEDGKIVDTYYSLIKPKAFHHDPYRYKVHQLSLKKLKHEREFPEIWKEIEKYFKHHIVIGHDVQNDLFYLRASLRRHQLEYPELYVSCTSVIAHYLEPTLPKYNLSYLCDYFGIKMKQAHNALRDAYGCAYIYQALMHQYGYTSIIDFHTKTHIALGKMSKNYYRNVITPEHASIVSSKHHVYANKYFTIIGDLKAEKSLIENKIEEYQGFYTKGINMHTDYVLVRKKDYLQNNTMISKSLKKVKTLQKYGQDIKYLFIEDFLTEN